MGPDRLPPPEMSPLLPAQASEPDRVQPRSAA